MDALIGNLHNSFGLLLLLLALAAAVPGISVLAGLLLLILAGQMIVGYSAPIFPRWVGHRTLSARSVVAVIQRGIPALKQLEKAVRPRWSTPIAATKRVVGVVVLLLTLRLLLMPVPLSNVLPAIVIALIALAYLEQDGLVLAIGLLAGALILAVDVKVIFELVRGAKQIGHFWPFS